MRRRQTTRRMQSLRCLFRSGGPLTAKSQNGSDQDNNDMKKKGSKKWQVENSIAENSFPSSLPTSPVQQNGFQPSIKGGKITVKKNSDEEVKIQLNDLIKEQDEDKDEFKTKEELEKKASEKSLGDTKIGETLQMLFKHQS